MRDRQELCDLLKGIVSLQQYVHNYKMPNRLIIKNEYQYRVNELERMGYKNIAQRFREYVRH